MHSSPAPAALRSGLLVAAGLLILTQTRPATAVSMDRSTEDRVRRAVVQVWMGEAVEGQKERKWLGSGSGSFINRTGLVVTNNHVVDPGHGKSPAAKFQMRARLSVLKYKVVLHGGTDDEIEYEAKVRYQNESADLAIIQVIEEDEMALRTPDFLELMPSDNIEKGDVLFCFGFPGGDKMATRKDKHAEVSISQGNVIDVPRTPGGRIRQIDTDVKAAPGNSGGPLVSEDGRTVGILSQGTISNETGDGILVRIIPADLVADMVKAAIFLGKLGSNIDVEPFLNLLTDKSGRVFLPDLEREPDRATIRLVDNTQFSATLADEGIKWKSPLGTLHIPASLAAYVLAEDGQSNLLLDGGDHLRAISSDVTIDFITTRGKRITQSLDNVAKIAFSKPEHILEVPNVEATAIEADGCRVFLVDLEGEAKFKTEDRVVSLKINEIRRITSQHYKQIVTTIDGASYRGSFEPHELRGKLVWSNTPVTLTLERLKQATLRQTNPAKAGRSKQSLAQRLDVDHERPQRIVTMLEAGQMAECRKALDEALERKSLRSLPKPVQEQILLLDGEYLLRTAKFEEASSRFRKLRRARLKHVKWYAASRYEMLDNHPDGIYTNGESLADPAVFHRAAEEVAERAVRQARATVTAYEKAMPNRHSGWKNLTRTIEDHEEQLQIADSLDPGRAENDVFVMWRFCQNLNGHEIQRIFQDIQETQRKLEDSRGAPERSAGIQRRLQRYMGHRRDVQRFGEDIQEKMNTAGFRLDDPAAIEILY